jgi:hypothetical protein
MSGFLDRIHEVESKQVLLSEIVTGFSKHMEIIIQGVLEASTHGVHAEHRSMAFDGWASRCE